MKHVYPLLLLLIAAPAVAQRSVDLELTMIAPQQDEYLPPMQNFTIQVSVKNVGTENLSAADTLYYYLLIDGYAMTFQPQNEDHLEILNTFLAPGDSVLINRVMGFDQSFEGSSVDLCIRTLPVNAADPVSDPGENDNQDCALVHVSDPAGIADPQAAAFTVSPNPATDVLHIASETAIEQVILADASGKIIAVAQGNTDIDCSTLQAGVYLLTAVTASGVSTQRVVVE